MIFLSNFDKLNDNTWKVNSVHYMPFDEVSGLHKTKEELEDEGILIEVLPDKDSTQKGFPVLCANLNTKEVFYKYEEPYKEDKVPDDTAILKETVLTLMAKVAQLEKQVGGAK